MDYETEEQVPFLSFLLLLPAGAPQPTSGAVHMVEAWLEPCQPPQRQQIEVGVCCSAGLQTGFSFRCYI